jgi:DNA primase
MNFRRELLPMPGNYFEAQGVKLTGGGEWKNAICPFHEDSKPSLRLRLDTGGFRCMACGAHGGDVLSFHMQRHGLTFAQAAKELGAWVRK